MERTERIAGQGDEVSNCISTQPVILVEGSDHQAVANELVLQQPQANVITLSQDSSLSSTSRNDIHFFRACLNIFFSCSCGEQSDFGRAGQPAPFDFEFDFKLRMFTVISF